MSSPPRGVVSSAEKRAMRIENARKLFWSIRSCYNETRVASWELAAACAAGPAVGLLAAQTRQQWSKQRDRARAREAQGTEQAQPSSGDSSRPSARPSIAKALGGPVPRWGPHLNLSLSADKPKLKIRRKCSVCIF